MKQYLSMKQYSSSLSLISLAIINIIMAQGFRFFFFFCNWHQCKSGIIFSHPEKFQDIISKKLRSWTFDIWFRFKENLLGFPGSSDGKESACNVVDPSSVPGSGRAPGEGNGYPLQDSCLENSMDRGAGQATVCGVSKIWTRLNDQHTVLTYFSP